VKCPVQAERDCVLGPCPSVCTDKCNNRMDRLSTALGFAVIQVTACGLPWWIMRRMGNVLRG